MRSDLTGPVLWTDTVKCQKSDDTPTFSHSDFPDTVRRCVANYLHAELEACPREWIAIGVGREAFAALSLVCPNRFVLGVPHCTGRYSANTFDKLFQNGRLLPQLARKFKRCGAKSHAVH